MARQQPPQPDINYLTNDDVRVLKEFINEARSKRINSQIRQDDIGDHQAPEFYVAKPETTIPGLTASGLPVAGTDAVDGPGDGDVPGTAICNIYQLRKSDGTMQKIAIHQTVYNIASGAIDADTWIQVTRDKFGNWWALVQNPPTLATGGGKACECCDCFDCIDIDTAAITGCVNCPSGAAYQYVTFFGGWSAYPALGGSQVFTYATGCTWLSPLVLIEGGYYRWQLTQAADASEVELLHIAGPDPILAPTTGTADPKSAIYVVLGDWSCLCASKMQAFDRHSFPRAGGLNCQICISPYLTGCTCCMTITVSGIESPWDALNGTFHFKYLPQTFDPAVGCYFRQSPLNPVGDPNWSIFYNAVTKNMELAYGGSHGGLEDSYYLNLGQNNPCSGSHTLIAGTNVPTDYNDVQEHFNFPVSITTNLESCINYGTGTGHNIIETGRCCYTVDGVNKCVDGVTEAACLATTSSTPPCWNQTILGDITCATPPPSVGGCSNCPVEVSCTWTWNGVEWIKTVACPAGGTECGIPTFSFPPGTHIGDTTNTVCA